MAASIGSSSSAAPPSPVTPSGGYPNPSVDDLNKCCLEASFSNYEKVSAYFIQFGKIVFQTQGEVSHGTALLTGIEFVGTGTVLHHLFQSRMWLDAHEIVHRYHPVKDSLEKLKELKKESLNSFIELAKSRLSDDLTEQQSLVRGQLISVEKQLTAAEEGLSLVGRDLDFFERTQFNGEICYNEETYKIAKLALETGASLNSQNPKGETPLQMFFFNVSCEKQWLPLHEKMLNLFLQHKPDFLVPDESGILPLWYVTDLCSTESIQKKIMAIVTPHLPVDYEERRAAIKLEYKRLKKLEKS